MIPIARKVKCRITGEVGTSDTFVKVDNYYYKSYEVYKNDLAEKQLKKNIIEIILVDFLEYKSTSMNPSLITKRLNELHENFTYEIILATIQHNYNSIIKGLKTKRFDSQYQKIAYTFAIINNHISDVADQQKNEVQDVVLLSDENLEFMAELLNYGNSVGEKQKQKNISCYLEEF